jgi:hypothetical protein
MPQKEDVPPRREIDAGTAKVVQVIASDAKINPVRAVNASGVNAKVAAARGKPLVHPYSPCPRPCWYLRIECCGE